MPKQRIAIPVNRFGTQSDEGILLDTMFVKNLPADENFSSGERHDRHTFHLVLKGSLVVEVDFKRYEIRPPSLVYMHPDQVHRISAFRNVLVSTWAISDANLNPAYLRRLEDIRPAAPLRLDKKSVAIFSDTMELCRKFLTMKETAMGVALLKDGCNALVALAISQYLDLAKTSGAGSRFDTVNRSFREALEKDFARLRRPSEYARQLNVSTHYLNECVNHVSGHPVSWHIRERIVLEAKRLLAHADLSVKEIASRLGFDDHAYFSRLFARTTGKTASAFRREQRNPA